MTAFDPSSSILAGMDDTVLQTRLTNLQMAYLDLTSGGKVEAAVYGMGDGTKSVTFTRATLADLVQTIRLVQAQLGIVAKPRRALGVRF